jgi:hypothetical protein
VFLNTCLRVDDPPSLQAAPFELALKLPGKAMHMRALCEGLKSVRSCLSYVKNRLDDRGVTSPWKYVQDTVARELTMASMFLGGILDGCVIAELPHNQAPTRYMSFFNTQFRDNQLRTIQEKVIALRSSDKEDQEIYVNLSTVINFWKHYLPYQPLPTEFTRGRRYPLCDFQLVLSGDGEALSGPILHDLLIPAFNAACNIVNCMLQMYDVVDNVDPIDM